MVFQPLKLWGFVIEVVGNKSSPKYKVQILLLTSSNFRTPSLPLSAFLDPQSSATCRPHLRHGQVSSRPP